MNLRSFLFCHFCFVFSGRVDPPFAHLVCLQGDESDGSIQVGTAEFHGFEVTAAVGARGSLALAITAFAVQTRAALGIVVAKGVLVNAVRQRSGIVGTMLQPERRLLAHADALVAQLNGVLVVVGTRLRACLVGEGAAGRLVDGCRRHAGGLGSLEGLDGFNSQLGTTGTSKDTIHQTGVLIRTKLGADGLDLIRGSRKVDISSSVRVEVAPVVVRKVVTRLTFKERLGLIPDTPVVSTVIAGIAVAAVGNFLAIRGGPIVVRIMVGNSKQSVDILDVRIRFGQAHVDVDCKGESIQKMRERKDHFGNKPRGTNQTEQDLRLPGISEMW
jgi:hypothetical protein